MKSEETETPHKVMKPRPIAVYVAFAAALYIVIQAYSFLAPILLSLFLIVLITLAVNPIIVKIRTWAGGRKRATGLALAGMLTLGALSVWAMVGPFQESVSIMADKLPAYWERLQKPLIKMEQQAVLTEEKLQEEVSAEIARESPEPTEEEGSGPTTFLNPPRHDSPQPVEAPENSTNGDRSLRSSLIEFIQGTLGQFSGIAQNTTDILIVMATVLFGVIFCLMNPRPIFGAFFSVIPERHHPKTLTIMVRIANFVPIWAASVLVSMVTIGSLFFILMWPIFQFSDAIMLGLIASIFSAIPFLGPILTLIPAILLAIGEGGLTPMWVVLAYVSIQALEGNVILPLIMSRGMKLHPVAVIFAMLLSVAAFGVLGVLIAAPLASIVGIIHEELYRKHFLPTVTDEDLDLLAREALLEKPSAQN